MTDIEFAQRLVNVLTDKELQDAVRQASAKGFMIPGYKNAWKASKMQIVSAMKFKIKGDGRNGRLLIEAVSTLNDDYSTDKITAKQLAKRWLEKKENTEQEIIIDDLKKMEAVFLSDIVSKKENRQNITETTNRKSIDDEKIEKLTKRITELQNKNKQHSSTIRSNKIQISNMGNENEHLKKNIERLLCKVAEKDNIICEIKEKLQEQKQLLEIKEEMVQSLKEEIQLLQKFKDRAPKILCFYKETPQDIDLSGFNITYAKQLDEKQRLCIENNEYDKIWIIVKKFSFNEICEIKHLAGTRAMEFYSLSKLKDAVGGQNGFKR